MQEPSFVQIREGQVFFCVDLTWNDPTHTWYYTGAVLSSGGTPTSTGTLLFPIVSHVEVPHITEDWGGANQLVGGVMST